MTALTLVIGNRNYSSWSLRPWLALRAAGVPFEEVLVNLNDPDVSAQILRHSPTAKVPVLRHGTLVVWESLAICEYVAELFPEARLWPEDREARAMARCAATEMHAGFADMRTHMNMNIRARHPEGTNQHIPAVAADVARVKTLWNDCRAYTKKNPALAAQGPYLFGAYGIVDAMFAPVVARFVTYGVSLEGEAKVYHDAMLAHPHYVEWIRLAGAQDASWTMEKYERPCT